MSPDGFVAHPTDGVNHLFAWYANGDVTVPTADPRWTLHTSKASADRLRATFANVGALVSGRRTFDDAGGWGGFHPVGAPVFVVTHSVPDGWPRADAPITFVTDGLDKAVEQAKAVAGDKLVAINSADITQQCLNAGLLDQIHVDLVPVLLGEGIRFFDHLASGPVLLADPEVVEGTGVTHLMYRVNH